MSHVPSDTAAMNDLGARWDAAVRAMERAANKRNSIINEISVGRVACPHRFMFYRESNDNGYGSWWYSLRAKCQICALVAHLGVEVYSVPIEQSKINSLRDGYRHVNGGKPQA